jgi:hypothetical protein
MTCVEWGKYQNFWHTGYSHHRGKSEFLYDSACLIIVNFLVVFFLKYSILVSFSNFDLVYSWKEVYLLVNTPFQYRYFVCACMMHVIFSREQTKVFCNPLPFSVTTSLLAVHITHSNSPTSWNSSHGSTCLSAWLISRSSIPFFLELSAYHCYCYHFLGLLTSSGCIQL